MTSNQIAYANFLELRRHNTKSENLTHEANKEMARHNRKSEDLGYYDAATSRMNASTNAVNAQTNAFNAHTNYYKAQTEAAKLTETKRHNEISEMISAGGYSASILGQSISGNLAIYPIAFGSSGSSKPEPSKGIGRRQVVSHHKNKYYIK